jgi:hypothetical protein
MSEASEAGAVAKTIVVRCDQATAFRVWVAQIDAWWPKAHSRSGDPRATVVLEPRAGGRIYERTPDGAEHTWGAITTWNPPGHLAFHWYLGSGAERPTRVDVRFSPQASGATRVDLVHQGPQLIGELWSRNRTIYDTAWEHVLGGYLAACAAEGLAGHETGAGYESV